MAACHINALTLKSDDSLEVQADVHNISKVPADNSIQYISDVEDAEDYGDDDDDYDNDDDDLYEWGSSQSQ